MVNWKATAEDDLKKLDGLRAAIANNRERLEMLEAELTSVRAIGFGGMPHGNKVRGDESMLGRLIEKEELEKLLEKNIKHVKWIEKGLAALDEEERVALECFYVKRYRYAADVVCDTLAVERSTAYNIRNRALWKYITAMYGAV